MSWKKQVRSNRKESLEQRTPKPDTENPDSLSQLAVSAGMADPSLLTPRNVLQLQHTIGNQSTGRLLAGTTQNQPLSPDRDETAATHSRQEEGKPAYLMQGGQENRTQLIQREIENEYYDESSSDEDANAAHAFFSLVNEAVQNAFNFTISVPSLGAYVELDGHTRLWKKKWNEFLGGGRPKLMAATFGYVIETLVSNENSEFCPASNIPAGYGVVPQQTEGGTRPDLVLRLQSGSGDIAWLDLTASGSVDHIFDKDGWPERIGIFAEVTYPSLTPDVLAMMRENKDNEGQLDPEEFARRLEVAKQVYAERKGHWRELGWDFAYSSLWRQVPGTREMHRLMPETPRKFIRERLQQYFEVGDLAEKMVPSILIALGVNPTSWGFATGYSMTEAAGEAWLVDNDPSL